jgi:hypothetical protein
MNAAMLLIWLTGALAGSMLFFAVVVAPTVFRALPAEAAGSFLRGLFPLYFLWGLVMSSICTIIAVYAAELVSGSICALVATLFAYARYSLLVVHAVNKVTLRVAVRVRIKACFAGNGMPLSRNTTKSRARTAAPEGPQHNRFWTTLRSLERACQGRPRERSECCGSSLRTAPCQKRLCCG